MKTFSLRGSIVALIVILASSFGLPAAPIGAVGGTVTLTEPAEGTTLTSFGPTLTWTNPSGVTQYHLQVIPFNNDGPGVDVHIGSAGASFAIPAPPSWYGLLPDMTYTWRVRVSDATTFVDLNDPSWGPWAERRFRTPAVSSSTITSLTPVVGDIVNTLTPIIQWSNSRSDVFYYEVQLSKDASFNVDPATATAMVYGELRHGGVTPPVNSYAVPPSFPLENNTTYFWRVRPRVQGDGTPLAWSAIYSFQTKLGAVSALTVEVASFGLSQADSSTCQISGATSAFASTPTLTGVFFAFKYTGAGAVSRSWYQGEVPLFAYGGSLTGPSGCYRSGFMAPGGGPNDGSPLTPGAYRMEVWYAGQKIQTSTFTIAPATGLAIGPITVGAGVASSSGCRLSGVANSFPAGTNTIVFRWNYVGSGSFTTKLYQGTTERYTSTNAASGPIGCVTWESSPPGGFTAGTWRRDILVGSQVVQSATFAVN